MELRKELNGTEVVSPAEIAERFAVSLPAVYVWARQADFPEPLLTMGGEQRKRNLYSLDEVAEWVAKRETLKGGRGKAHLLGRKVLSLANTNPELYSQIVSLLDRHDSEVSASMDRHPAGARL
jgi:predicted DNA-binding transcriptional regulator AlpA